MNIDANVKKNSLNEENTIEDKVASERRSFIQVSELKVDSASQVEKHGSTSGLQAPSVLQVQQQNQRTLFCWERFLHVRTIRVLLVEDDDSTRHVLTALLRNCNYEVLDAANGLQAWKILEDVSNHIDIVLTEVVMPSLSGIGLLSKIMSHQTRNNIPVIMMSSHDSMGLVFKCLSKGAVDFLVKPIRKNELKNLWQHVWRRCHSSSGSGSESGTRPQKSVKSKGSERSGNNSSNGGENDASNGTNVGEGSDEGSGAQSSWTKQAVEVDSSQALSPVDQVPECQDSTCAQVIRPNAEHSDYNEVQVSVLREGHEQKTPDTVEEGNYLETIVNRSVELKSDDCVEGQPNPSGKESECTREVAYELDLNNDATDDCKEPNLELSLKRIRGVQDTGRSVQDDRYVLRRSEQSAFSRYNTSVTISRAHNGVTSNNSVLDNSTEVPKRVSVGDMLAYSTDHVVYQSSNGVSNNVDMGSTTNKLPKDKSEATSTTNVVNPSAFVRPIKEDLRYSKNKDFSLPSGMQSTDSCQINQNYHHHHHFHIENQPSSNYDESSLKKLAVDASHCGSTNVFGGSASGSNYGSNGQNGSSTAINGVGNNADSDVGQAGKSGSGDASGSGGGNKADADKFAQRAAALIKFRQKRKERCFKKKVRYQNRKKLAEQRPRVRGQFVKQTEAESPCKTGDE